VRYSLIGDNRGSELPEANPDADGNIVGGPIDGVIDPQLEPLAVNGGPTLSHVPRLESPVLEAGDPEFVAPPDFDQRGAPRRVDDRIDIGAIELLLADFNGDLSLNIPDIDLLTENVATGTNDPVFDITGDSLVDLADVERWLEIAGRTNLPSRRSYLFGDANLDARVNSADLGHVGINWQQDTSGWSQGDFNGDGRVDVGDLNMLGLNWVQDASEPAKAALSALPVETLSTRLPRAPLAKTIGGDVAATPNIRLADQDLDRWRSETGSEARRSETENPNNDTRHASFSVSRSHRRVALQSFSLLRHNSAAIQPKMTHLNVVDRYFEELWRPEDFGARCWGTT
jgi:hypothetical protein